MNQLFSIFVFYRPFVFWSFGFNIVFSFLKYNIIPILIAKLFLVVFIWTWFFMDVANSKQKLIFHKNLGISSFKLFALSFIIDLFLSIPFLLILKEFI
ncbi:hypothetical protein C1H87_20570 [Flavivirga eckloniae]|uniref:Uncharacterized protein n=1 Tax=Flavivirga eckloniae TaxID=1803846 RepID=A0A2K9PV78_9FLAO|nr:hypothetical protein C1H87_20570 [Flavivirga eckloniae]